jgi:hypothetical protein
MDPNQNRASLDPSLHSNPLTPDETFNPETAEVPQVPGLDPDTIIAPPDLEEFEKEMEQPTIHETKTVTGDGYIGS